MPSITEKFSTSSTKKSGISDAVDVNNTSSFSPKETAMSTSSTMAPVTDDTVHQSDKIVPAQLLSPAPLGHGPKDPTPRRRTLRPNNPYVLKRGNLKTDWRLADIEEFKLFLNTIDEYITILTQHKNCSTEAWHLQWKEWLDDDILTADTLHMVAVTVDFPADTDCNHLNVGKYILRQLPILDGYITIPLRTRDDDPLCYLSKPTPVETNPLSNNSYQALADDDDSLSVQDTLQIEVLADSDDDAEAATPPQHNSPATSTETLIQNMNKVVANVDKEITDIATIISKDEPVPQSKDKPLTKTEVYLYMKEQQQIINTSNANYLTAIVDKELKRLQALFKTATNDNVKKINTTFDKQKKLITDISASTVQKCTSTIEDIDTHMASSISTLTDKINEAESDAIKKHKNSWTTLSSNMTVSHDKLVKTNSVAIKNNAVLTKKLKDAEKKIVSLATTISVQSASIDNLTTRLKDVEVRYQSVNDLPDEYVASITDAAKKSLSTCVTSYCKSDDVTQKIKDYVRHNTQTELDSLTTETRQHITDFATTIESDIKHKSDTISKLTCEYMQNRANSLSASIDISTNKANPPPAIPESDSMYDNEKANITPLSHKHPLFPDVNPNLFNTVRTEHDNALHNSNICHDQPTRPQYQNYNSNRSDYYRSNNNLPTEDQLKDYEYIYTEDGEFPKLHAVNIKTFYNIKWNSKCTTEMDIFHFYETLQHMASTCGIPMRDLKDIDNDDKGVCPLNPSNCQNYDKIYKLMKGAVFHKIHDSKLWEGYSHGWNLVTSNLSDCDGFEVMFDILSEILPALNIKLPKAQK